MTIEVTKKDLRNLLRGVPKSYSFCEKMTELGLMQFCGNQHNEDWCWITENLKDLTEVELYNIYKECTE